MRGKCSDSHYAGSGNLHICHQPCAVNFHHIKWISVTDRVSGQIKQTG